MPVWLAIGGVVVGAIIGGGDSHSDYSDYSNHSDYSDAEIRRERRREAARNEYDSARRTLIDIKNNQLKKYLSGTSMRNISDSDIENVNVNLVLNAGMEKINKDCENEKFDKTADLTEQVNEIDKALRQINEIRSSLQKEYNLDDKNKE